jgi:Ser/Thr protein kinase RdoA (MazF antagonist)
MTESTDLSAGGFANLSPELVLDALDTVGIRGDGRLLALNSYENRVYQVWCEDAPPLVAKFYRPQRWSAAQILEEHGFVATLVEREIPVVPALTLQDATLHVHAGFRFSVFERHGGRAPELEQAGILEWLGRFIGRIHAVGAIAPFTLRPSLDPATFSPAMISCRRSYAPLISAWSTRHWKACAAVMTAPGI